LTDEAKTYVVENALFKHPALRFPAFWSSVANWFPDQDHGSVTMIAFQRMIMQVEGDNIHIIPAWPKEWNCDFKLHAPLNTVIEGSVKDGKLIKMTVTPESRRKDIKIKQGKK